MQVKIFEAPDMTTGLRQIRKELGPDALILSTRTIKDGKMGLLGKKMLEITAAVDHQFDDKSTPKSSGHKAASVAFTYAENSNAAVEEKLGKTPLQLERNNTKANFEEDDLTFTLNPKKDKDHLKREFSELKEMVQSLAGQIAQFGNTESETAQHPAHILLNKLEKKFRTGGSNTAIEEILLKNGVNVDMARMISTLANEHFDEAEEHGLDKIYAFLHETIAELLTVATFDTANDNQQRRIALIGPTGVGKTTTLAKIAAKYLSKKSRSIALITVDTYRIAAVEQLKVYGEIMHLPVEVVITPQQLLEALEKHHDKELILIDTAGRSPQDIFSIDELRCFFAPELNIETHLVLSATTREKELLETLHKFNELHLQSTIFTKTDECVELGVILNVQAQSSSPLTFITNGQKVPEDIVEADNKQLAQLIIPTANGVINE